MTAVIWWMRRDLRLHDNFALQAALAHGEPVVPIFVLDPRLLQASDVSDKRVAFLFGGLKALDADLRARGSRLIVGQGDPVDVLGKLCAETGATAVFAEADPWPYARQRDAAVAERPFPRVARDHLLAGRLPALAPIRGEGGFGGSVKNMLASMLADDIPTIRDMAKLSGTSVRTFQRRLSGESLVYSDLVEEVRQAHALRLMSKPNATAKSVSGDLGYEYQSSFTRAMLRWTGASPKKFKSRRGNAR